MKIADGRFEYEDDRFPIGRNCACRLRVWVLPDGRNVAIATELINSPGASVTNSAERWASEMCRRYIMDPLNTIFIEHYDRRAGKIDPCFPPETFDAITFTWSGARVYKELDQELHAMRPQWKPMKKQKVEELVGEKLP